MVTVFSGMFSVGPRLRLEGGDADVAVLEPGRERVGVERERVLEELRVVACRGVDAGVGGARPAAAPNTRHSDSEFEPGRLPPLRPTLGHSPAAWRPRIGVAPEMSASTPPIM